MVISNLYCIGEVFVQIGKGYGIDVFGFFDSLDLGSDVVGGLGLGSDVEDCFDKDFVVYLYGNVVNCMVGVDLGDVNFDSDIDFIGIGECCVVGYELVICEGGDLMFDVIYDIYYFDVDILIDDENFEYVIGLVGENDDVDVLDVVDLDEVLIDLQLGSWDVLVYLFIEGGIDWFDNMC